MLIKTGIQRGLDSGGGGSLSDLSAGDASFLCTLRNTVPGTKKAAAGPLAAQESHINDNYKGYGKKIPSCPKREHQNSVIDRRGEDS